MPAWDFDAVYQAHARMVYWTAYGILKNEHDAMDVSQDTFLRALKHRLRLGMFNEAQTRAWLYRVAVNLCMDKKRGEKRLFPAQTEEVFEQADTDEAILPENAALNGEQRAALRAAIDALPDIYRQTVMLHYFSELDYNAIAALDGVSEGTVKSRMSRAKALLAKSLKGGEAHE